MKAFPQTRICINGDKDITTADLGMDLRDYFAAKAMQGLLMAQKNYDDVDGYYQNSLSLAIHSYIIADTMMKAREE